VRALEMKVVQLQNRLEMQIDAHTAAKYANLTLTLARSVSLSLSLCLSVSALQVSSCPFLFPYASPEFAAQTLCCDPHLGRIVEANQ
jgi:hypothetical protein